VDESGINTCLQREYGRALRGKKVEDVRRGRKFERTNVIAGYSEGRILADICYKEPTTGMFFECWFEEFLLAEVREGKTIIMDNASFHRKKALKEIAIKHGVKIVFLPPYSPDYNPIEKVWANMKRALPDTIQFYKNIDTAVYEYFALRNSLVK
jgi:hypothetical protein